jgi:hypothetical protein
VDYPGEDEATYSNVRRKCEASNSFNTNISFCRNKLSQPNFCDFLTAVSPTFAKISSDESASC